MPFILKTQVFSDGSRPRLRVKWRRISMMIKHHLKGRGPDTFDVIVYIESLITRIHDFESRPTTTRSRTKELLTLPLCFWFLHSDSFWYWLIQTEWSWLVSFVIASIWFDLFPFAVWASLFRLVHSLFVLGLSPCYISSIIVHFFFEHRHSFILVSSWWTAKYVGVERCVKCWHISFTFPKRDMFGIFICVCFAFGAGEDNEGLRLFRSGNVYLPLFLFLGSGTCLNITPHSDER